MIPAARAARMLSANSGCTGTVTVVLPRLFSVAICTAILRTIWRRCGGDATGSAGGQIFGEEGGGFVRIFGSRNFRGGPFSWRGILGGRCLGGADRRPCPPTPPCS